MNQSQPNNPLHGITLKAILEYLVAEYGWDRLGDRINIHCFQYEPSINSSLKFLRKADWARAKVERLYLNSISFDQRKGKNNVDVDVDVDEEPNERGSVWDRARRQE
ncbi:VF530 family protein [Stieleria sp. TO1_6]|uniref:VF530 family protein n=1 Tax=Stieleria tagensis TaxID=2956795 RepID=UPI00209AECE0|nr:VF530 family protein [Stieleria tagensis]MCO8123513.1 VF530 family protein [Stieleria tagensis]